MYGRVSKTGLTNNASTSPVVEHGLSTLLCYAENQVTTKCQFVEDLLSIDQVCEQAPRSRPYEAFVEYLPYLW